MNNTDIYPVIGIYKPESMSGWLCMKNAICHR